MAPDPLTLAHAFETWAFIAFGDHGPARLYGFTGWDVEQRRPLGLGDPHKIVSRAVPPAGLVALGYTVMGWCAPLPADGSAPACRPSLHPARRRMRTAVLVTGEGDLTSVVRYFDNGEIAVLRGGVGALPELLGALWARRPDRMRC